MEVDSDNSAPAKKRAGHSINKVRIVENNKLVQANAQLQAQLLAARESVNQQSSLVNALQQEMITKGNIIAEMQNHESEMEAQFFGDQEKLEKLRTQLAQLMPHYNTAQTLLMQRNDEVKELTDLMVEKNNEIIQLRSNNVHSQKTPQRTPPAPRRGTLANAVYTRNTRLIDIPLDPIPVVSSPGDASTPPGKATPSDAPTPGRTFTATPALAQLFNTDIETLDPVIKMFEQLFKGEVAVKVDKPAPTQRKQSTPRKKSKETGSQLVGDLKKYVHAILRNAVYNSFNVERVADFQTHVPANDASVAACEDRIADPAPEVYQWDFGPHYLSTRWNELMIDKLVDVAVKYDDKEQQLFADRDVERPQLALLLLEKLESYRAEWKKLQPRLLKNMERIETAVEARARATRDSQQSQLTMRSNSSKHRKYRTRVETITTTIELKTHEAGGDIATWERLLEMIELLGEEGMSSEEEDELEVDDNKFFIFKVKICVWREPKIIHYLRFVDGQTAEFKKKQRGRKPVQRIRGVEPGCSEAPTGLPKSLYSQDWLQSQSPLYLKELNVSKKVFELFVAATERMAF